MQRYLITHSLLSSWAYAMKEDPYEQGGEGEVDNLPKLEEFMLTLNREPVPANEAMRKGNDFENLVNRTIYGAGDKKHHWYEAAAEIAQMLAGAQLQLRAKKEAEAMGVPVLLYGRFDALLAGVVYDIKYSSNYEAGKYIGSTQHPMYLEICQDADRFTYLVSDGSHLYAETYRRDETPGVLPLIGQFFQWLETRSLMGLYKEKWAAL